MQKYKILLSFLFKQLRKLLCKWMQTWENLTNLSIQQWNEAKRSQSNPLQPKGRNWNKPWLGGTNNLKSLLDPQKEEWQTQTIRSSTENKVFKGLDHWPRTQALKLTNQAGGPPTLTNARKSNTKISRTWRNQVYDATYRPQTHRVMS